MTLKAHWHTRSKLVGNPDTKRGSYLFDTFHVYVTAYERPCDLSSSSSTYEHQVVYGEIRVCESVGVYKAIDGYSVRQVKYREPYNHCKECMDWVRHVFPTIPGGCEIVVL